MNTAVEALAASIPETVKVDMAYMSQLSRKSEEKLTMERKGITLPMENHLQPCVNRLPLF